MFDKDEAKRICERLMELHKINSSHKIHMHIEIDPISCENEVSESLRVGNRAALLLPAALDRIETLEQTLIEERSRGNWYFDLVNEGSRSYIPWSVKAQPGNGASINDSFISDYRRVSREQLQQEGIL
jgi:hypothetical protein